MVYYVGSALPPNFRDLQYACLQEKYAGLAEEHYPNMKRLTHEFDNPSPNLLSTLSAFVDSPDDQTATRAPWIVKRVFNPHICLWEPNTLLNDRVLVAFAFGHHLIGRLVQEMPLLFLP